MGATLTGMHKWKYANYVIGALAMLAVVAVLGLPMFQPHNANATRGPATVVCGSTNPLLTTLGDFKSLSAGPSGSGPVTLASCSATYGGTTEYMAFRRVMDGATATYVNVIYKIYVDGSPTPLITFSDPTATTGTYGNWSFDKYVLTSTMPIKFTSSLTVTAEVPGDATMATTAFKVAGHVTFTPGSEVETPVKFLTPQAVNVNNVPWVYIGNYPWVNILNQPIHTVTP
jgi:hypothetical protein